MTINKQDSQVISTLKLRKEQILAKLSEQGYRITKQRKILIDIILNGNCLSCKEIHAQASQLDSSIGKATVYRMIKTLEGLGTISRNNLFTIKQDHVIDFEKEMLIVLKSKNTIQLSMMELKPIMEEALRVKGYLHRDEIQRIVIKK